MKKTGLKRQKKKSIFLAIFVPLIFIMVLQSMVFYLTAVYGGTVESLNQNASDILAERLSNRRNELESRFYNNWSDLTQCQTSLDTLYRQYQTQKGHKPLTTDPQLQIQFLEDSVEPLISTLRRNDVNGVFLILNDEAVQTSLTPGSQQKKYGLCIRDMDQTSAYADREDLLLERSPSALIEKTGCTLDTWWEAFYTFSSEKDGSYYYKPLNAAWENPGSKSDDLSYFCGSYSFSSSPQHMVSYSVPLMDDEGYPYGVLGIELTTKYLSSLLPNQELGSPVSSCYILSLHSVGQTELTPLTAAGSLYNRCFSSDEAISCADTAATGGFYVNGRGNVRLYGVENVLSIYNHNNPFEDEQLTLTALTEVDSLFYYSQHIKMILFWVTMVSLVFGILGIFIASRSFANPITSMARRVQEMDPQKDVKLERLGISEIDQLIDALESLSQNVSKEVARTDFFSRMSHDMRTPMNAIIGFSSPELVSYATDEEKGEYLQKIHSSGEYLLGLINEVLDMTKIESNKVDLHYEPTAASQLWDTVLPMVKELAQDKGITFSSDLPRPKKLWLLADRQHLNQILMNLLSNAIKFTPAGGNVSLKASFRDHLQQMDCIECCIQVQDTGIGMSEEFQKKLYTPFEQEHSDFGGTGLGLSITKKLVELMGGSIVCTSQLNQGTCFTICLPMTKASRPQEVPAAAPAFAPPAQDILRGKRILLCEDHPLNAQIAMKLLDRRGMMTDLAVNGQEGVSRFEACPPGTYAAILMDIRMPVLDGLQATAQIRSMERSDARTIPIIAMTANAFDSDIQESKRAGMNAHLSKPIEPEKLFDTLCMFIHA